jgi:hypothetical protein
MMDADVPSEAPALSEADRRGVALLEVARLDLVQVVPAAAAVVQ